VRWDTSARWDRAASASWIVVHRGDARVVVNLAAGERRIELELTGPTRVLAAWEPVRIELGDVVVPGCSVAVVGPAGP